MTAVLLAEQELHELSCTLYNSGILLVTQYRRAHAVLAHH